MPTPIYRRLYERVTLYDEAGTAVEAYHALVAGSPSGDPFLIEPQLEARGDGQEREVGRRSAFEIATGERHVIRQLRAWIAAGTSVRAVTVGAGLLAQWDEPAVPVEVDRATGPLSLDGPAFRLASVLRRAAVYRDADLLAPLKAAALAAGASWDGDVDRVLPVPSSPYARPLRVWAHSEDGDEVTVTAYSFDDEQLGTATSGTANTDGSTTAALALPVGTWYVTVATDGASWPSLYTRAPAPVEVVVPSGGGCTFPDEPENVAVGALDGGSYPVTWDAVEGVESGDGYLLEYGDTDGGPYPNSVFIPYDDLADPNSPNYDLPDPGYEPYAQVSAYLAA